MSFSITDDQIDWIISEIQDQDDTLHNPVKSALNELGLTTPSEEEYSLLMEKIQDTMFICDICETWKNREIRVYNALLNMKCCEECDENNQ
jgi:hypothetical protein